MIGCVFTVNLFIGVMFASFKKEESLANSDDFNKIEEKWKKIQYQILKNNNFCFFPPQKGIKKFLYTLLNKGNFMKFFINICLFINLILLIFEIKHENHIFIILMSIYVGEVLIKIYVYKSIYYFNDSDFLLEFFIAISYIIVMVNSTNKFESIEYKYKKLLLLFKTSILLRIIKNLSGLKKILRILNFSFKLILNMIVLLMIDLLIYSIIGCYMFGRVKKGKIIDDYVNFKNFIYAMMTLFKCSTGDGWSNIMFDTMKIPPYCVINVDCGSSISIYFYIFILYRF